ncbi:MAG: response regulator [Sphingomonadaceae bacterium]
MAQEEAIRVLVVDDHAIVRKGICALLEAKPSIEVVGEASNGREAVALAGSLHPDVVLMDLVMPGMDGIEAIRQIAASEPRARILVLTSFAADDKLFPAIKAGAMGYLLKDSGPDELVRAIRHLYRGEASLDPTISRRVLLELARPADRPSALDALTEREIEVLGLVGQGLLNQEIAERLVITEATVRTHISNILGKLQLASRTQAALYALRVGLASLNGSVEGHG